MKTALISLSIATLLGLASYVSALSFNAEQLIAVLFVAGLATWTITLYSRKLKPLTVRVAQPIHFPIKMNNRDLSAQNHRLAA
jgi:hypothetical protein